MKKTTLAAVSVVLVAASLAIWLGRDRPQSANQTVTSVDDALAPSASLTDEPDQAHTSPGESPIAAPTSETIGAGPARLFSSPDYGSIEYRNASDRAAAFLRGIEQPPILRTQLVIRNEAAIEDLIRQFETNANGLSTPFEVSGFADQPCTISIIEDTDPEFTPGLPIPATYRVESRCEETGELMTVGIERTGRTRTIIGIGISSVRFGGIAVKSFDDSKYAVAYQVYPESVLPRGTTIE